MTEYAEKEILTYGTARHGTAQSSPQNAIECFFFQVAGHINWFFKKKWQFLSTPIKQFSEEMVEYKPKKQDDEFDARCAFWCRAEGWAWRIQPLIA